MKRFFKAWMLPISMAVGVMLYVTYREIPFLHPYGQHLRNIITTTQPCLIFMMLYCSFCKVNLMALRPRRFHILPLLLQATIFLLSAIGVYLLNDGYSELVVEAFMVCMICPTATAAVVVTGKLGGDRESVTMYTILINLVVAILIPCVVPLLHPHDGQTFLHTFHQIIAHIFPILICPLIAAWLTKQYFPRLLNALLSIPDLAFYLWAISLSMCLTMTARSLYHSHVDSSILAGIALASLCACIFQFWAGRRIGKHWQRPISGAQSLGQKNTAFAIWMAYTFLDPITSVAGGFYSIWHNVYNSWQLAQVRSLKEPNDSKAGN